MSSLSTTLPSTLTLGARWFSFFELVGHNIFHILPNEVPILFILGWISLRWRNGGWKYAGLSRPQSWVENRGVSCYCGGDPATRQRTRRGTGGPPHLAGTGTCLHCHPVRSIGLEAVSSQPIDCLEVCVIR